jgi:hypothetical protein
MSNWQSLVKKAQGILEVNLIGQYDFFKSQ